MVLLSNIPKLGGSRILKKLIRILLPVILLLSFSIQVSAEEIVNTDSSIHGHVKTVVKFPGRTLEQVQDLYKSIGVDLTSEENAILESNNGIPEINISMPNVILKIDESIVPIINNEFFINHLTNGTHKIQLYSTNSLVFEKEYTLDYGLNHIPLELNLDFNNLVLNAGVKMNSTISKDENNKLVSPFYDPDQYYNGIKVGSYFGEGKGKMKMLTPEGHVSCNKSDYDHGANFPFNGADCTKAVAGGVLYLSNPSLYNRYIQGIYCIQEAMGSGDDSNEANSYCNHKPKSSGYYKGYKNMGYNCSSFTFLNGDERLNKY